MSCLFLPFVNVGTATGVSPVQSTESLKTIKDGKVVIIRGDEKFDITGRKL